MSLVMKSTPSTLTGTYIYELQVSLINFSITSIITSSFTVKVVPTCSVTVLNSWQLTPTKRTVTKNDKKFKITFTIPTDTTSVVKDSD
jgi:hypothetical protein